MKAGAARIDITPGYAVWMDGMLRSHRSTGVHDPIFAKALVLCDADPAQDGVILISVDVCGFSAADSFEIRRCVAAKTGIAVERIVLAAIHNHSGPATVGGLTDKEEKYVKELTAKIMDVAAQATDALTPVMAGCASGREDTISHYRRLLADDGHVVMNWEPWPAERIVKVLGEIDPEIGVLKVVSASDPAQTVALLFNHAGHPNVLSGDNYLISSDYPGRAEQLLEQQFGGTALFFNGAQGSVDIDGLKDRDWEGRERVGRALASAVAQTAQGIKLSADPKLRVASERYTVPARKISAAELDWADRILKQTGGAVKSVADGVGDDYKAALYRKLHTRENQPVELEQTGVAIGDCALFSFPGELFTEIGMRIKARSPHKRTWCLGLANGEIGYIPTHTAIAQGGYEPDTRRADDSAAGIIEAKSLELLRRLV